MGKGATSLTNSLYKINDKIAQATNKQPMPGVPEVPEQQQIQTGHTSFQELAPERVIEFNRMHHDLEIRVESMLSEYQAEAELLELRKKELVQTSEQMKKLKQELEEIVLPGKNEPEQERTLSKRLRALELMRLETIRVSKKMDAAKTAAGNSTGDGNSGVNLMDIPNEELMKKGYAFFGPLIITLIVCTLLLGIAYILAWKVAI